MDQIDSVFAIVMTHDKIIFTYICIYINYILHGKLMHMNIDAVCFQGLKRQARTLLGSATHNMEEDKDSKEDEAIEDVGVMDYAQPHRKPPIHNRKSQTYPDFLLLMEFTSFLASQHKEKLYRDLSLVGGNGIYNLPGLQKKKK